MRRFNLILIAIFFVVVGVGCFAANFEFRTINPGYEDIPTYDKPDSYEMYKKKQELNNNNVSPAPELENSKEKSKQPQSEPQVVPNYGVYTPQEYTPINYQKEAVLFIMDFSGSMKDRVSGKRKIDMAIDTMYGLLPQMSPNMQLGLRIYGHRASVTAIDSCLASDLVVPISQKSAPKIYNELKNTKPRGNTPITYSLKQAVKKDFAKFTGKKRIVLLTDGGENCDESPCTYVTNNLTQRDDITIDVIAFDINSADANAQLKCTALVSNGKFYKADTEAQLVNSLTHSLNIHKDVQGIIIKDIK